MSVDQENQGQEEGKTAKKATTSKSRVSKTTSNKTTSLTSKSRTMATAAKNSNLFTSLINDSDSNLLKKRGDLISLNTEQALSMQLMQAKTEVNQIKYEISVAEDLGKTNTQSLTVGDNFDSNAWIETIFHLETQLLEATIKLDIIEKMYSKYFG